MPSKNLVLTVVSVVLVILLVGSILLQAPILVSLLGRISDLEKRVTGLNEQVSELQANLTVTNESLNRTQSELLRAYEQLEQLNRFFFVRDSNFTVPINQSPYWGVEAWNGNQYSICEVRNGNLHLIYNGTLTSTYGNSGVFQGTHTGGQKTSQPLLVGNSPQDSFDGEYVILPKNLQSGKFWLKTRFQIRNMGFNFPPSLYPPYARVNLGITLMCAINNGAFNITNQDLWLDVYFAGYFLNQTHTWVVPKGTSYVWIPEDIHAGYYVNAVDPQDFGTWIDVNVDLGGYVSKTLNLITQVDVRSIRVYGFILWVECIGAHAEAEYDYLETYTT